MADQCEKINKQQDNISQVKSLCKDGKFTQALELLEKITEVKGLSTEDRLVCIELETRIRMKRGEFKNASAMALDALPTALEKNHLYLALGLLSTIAECSWRLGQLDAGLRAVDKAMEITAGIPLDHDDEETIQLKERIGVLYGHGGIIHWYKGNLDLSIKYHQQSLEIMEQLEDLIGIANSCNNLGLVYWSKGDPEYAIYCYRRSLLIHEETGNKEIVAATLNNLGNAYIIKGELDSALEAYKRSLAIKTDLNSKKDIATTLINIGSVYRMKGEPDLALDYYKRSLVISEELGTKSNIALAYNNMGDIHMIRGELDQAQEFFQKGFELYEQLGLKPDVALSLSNAAEVYWKRGDIEQAQKRYMQSLAIYEEMKNAPYMSIVLFNLLWLAIEREDRPSAEHYLETLKQINERSANKIIDYRYRIARALWLKSTNRARQILEAVKILEEVVQEEVRDHALAVTAMIHLCDALLYELKISGEENLFGEIKELTNRLLEISKKQSSFSFLAETYLLQSKLALIELDMGQARKLLDRALSIAQGKGLNLLARVITQERESLLSHLQKWEMLIQQEPSKQKMIDITNIDVILERMIQKTVVSVMEEQGISGQETTKKKYKLVYLDRLKDPPKTERNRFRVGIAQIGLSSSGDILHELYKEHSPGLFGFREEIVDSVRSKIKMMVEMASKKAVDILIFPEMTVDLGYRQISEDISTLAKCHNIFLIPGAYHKRETKQNLSVIFSPHGILWEQPKHIPAMINFNGERITEGIIGHSRPLQTIISSTEFGRIAVVICRDFLDMDLRVELKNAEPPVDLIINPAFTPVTADFKAAHFDARRSIYAYCFFANVAEYGDSLIYSPEKESVEINISAKEEGLIYKDVDLFKLRSERKKWEIERAKTKPFIQSTR